MLVSHPELELNMILDIQNGCGANLLSIVHKCLTYKPYCIAINILRCEITGKHL